MFGAILTLNVLMELGMDHHQVVIVMIGVGDSAGKCRQYHKLICFSSFNGVILVLAVVIVIVLILLIVSRYVLEYFL